MWNFTICTKLSRDSCLNKVDQTNGNNTTPCCTAIQETIDSMWPKQQKKVQRYFVQQLICFINMQELSSYFIRGSSEDLKLQHKIRTLKYIPGVQYTANVVFLAALVQLGEAQSETSLTTKRNILYK